MLLQCFDYVRGVLEATPPMIRIALLLAFALLLGLRLSSSFVSRKEFKYLYKIGVQDSNMADQYSPHYKMRDDTPSHKGIHIKSIYIHPVK